VVGIIRFVSLRVGNEGSGSVGACEEEMRHAASTPAMMPIGRFDAIMLAA
jgi:hypothetical protein